MRDKALDVLSKRELMEIRIDQQPKAVIVVVQGRMDAVSAPQFESAMAEHIATGSSRFVVDCSALEYISSAGLRSLLTAAKALRTQNGEMVFAALGGMVHEVFDIAGFGTLFSVFDSIDAALEQW
jgi:anti-sigma B factor antagonist